VATRDDSRQENTEETTMTHYHALVWIDHREAKVFHFDAEHSQEVIVRNSHAHQNLHHKANAGDSGHVPVDKEYLRRVVAEIAKAGAILVVGPGTAKTELRSFVQQARPEVAAKIHAVEPMDHPTEGQLLAFGRKFFVADDRMHPQVHARA
jgi:stalled ribosome rescue protein Dom34